MRRALFDELAPVCPRCLHISGLTSPLAISSVEEERGGHVWHGVLTCTNRACWLEFPVIDGVPVITPDPGATLRMAEAALLTRTDLPPGVESIIGDALGPGAGWDVLRQHRSIYAGDHYADWSAPPGTSNVAATVEAAHAALPPAPEGPALDIGCGPGRAAWQLARLTGRTVLGCDLNLSFLRQAQRLAVDGQAGWPRRRIGLVYDPALALLPPEFAALPVDFWALDALQLPFPPGRFAITLAINVVDCVPQPAALIAEAARVTASDGAAAFTTPYDWSPSVPDIAGWLGGHSQRADHRGAGEPVLTATLATAGFVPVTERHDLPWRLRLHARAEMTYSLHLVACRRQGATEGA
jgi:SAM-dependent methyltransferase/uncharacterized protein YbaR (Trm112 family)